MRLNGPADSGRQADDGQTLPGTRRAGSWNARTDMRRVVGLLNTAVDRLTRDADEPADRLNERGRARLDSGRKDAAERTTPPPRRADPDQDSPEQRILRRLTRDDAERADVARKRQAGQDAQGGPVAAESLAPEQRREIERLAETDRRVRAHEQAILAAAGGLVRGGAFFSYTTGPDGRRYAVESEVQIDTAAIEGNPGATLLKARRIEAAALAPANPSPRDRQVAAHARQMAAEARRQMAAAEQDVDAAGAAVATTSDRTRGADPRVGAYTREHAADIGRQFSTRA